MTDWQVVEGHRSSASCSPGAQVMVRPHPQVLSLLRATAETSPLGCHVPTSRLHGDEATGRPRLRLAPLWSAPPSLRGESSLPYSNCTQVAIAAPPNPPIRSLCFFVDVAVFFKASARREAANSPPHSALAVLPL